MSTEPVVAVVAKPAVGARAVYKKRRSRGWVRQAWMQALCIFITITVLFPILYVVSMAFDGSAVSGPPSGLNLIPLNPTTQGFQNAIAHPSPNNHDFMFLAVNSIKLALMTSLISVAFGVSAAYAFSRLRFRLRSILMIAVLAVLMLPAVASMTPLYVLLNHVKIGDFNLRSSLLGVGLALISGALPFAIWNLKGYLDTIPKDLEEAAAIDGCSRNQAFLKIILPLAMPALAVTAFLGFVAGWTDFYFSWFFLDPSKDETLSMALVGMVGTYASTTPWSTLAAFSILVSLPVSAVYLIFQRWIVGGLAIGAVKG